MDEVVAKRVMLACEGPILAMVRAVCARVEKEVALHEQERWGPFGDATEEALRRLVEAEAQEEAARIAMVNAIAEEAYKDVGWGGDAT